MRRNDRIDFVDLAGKQFGKEVLPAVALLMNNCRAVQLFTRTLIGRLMTDCVVIENAVGLFSVSTSSRREVVDILCDLMTNCRRHLDDAYIRSLIDDATATGDLEAARYIHSAARLMEKPLL